MVSSLLVIGVVLAIIFIIFIAVGSKLEINEGERDVVKNVYIYLVLFATLMMTIGGSVAAFMAMADMAAPAPYYQSFEDFKHMDKEKYDFGAGADVNDKNSNLSETELKDRYEAMVQMEKAKQVDRAKNNLIKSFGWIIIPLPVFIYFQRRLVQKAK